MRVENKDELKDLVKKLGNFVYCVAKDNDGKVITPCLWIYEDSLMEDFVSGVRIYHDKEVGEYFNLTKIDEYYADVDAYPVYKDWIKFPLTDVFLYTDETEDLLNHYKELRMWRFME